MTTTTIAVPTPASRRPRRLVWLGCLLVSVFALLALAACGSSDSATKTTSSGSSSTAASGAAATITSVTGSASTAASGAAGTVASAATQLSGSPDVAQFSGIALQLATCAQQNTTGQVVTDLRAGKTDSAKQVYNDCVGSALPAALASQAEPVVNDAATCGQTAAKGMSDADISAAENGDQATIQTLTNETISCLVAKYGDLLQ
jgi:hypothetical protein